MNTPRLNSTDPLIESLAEIEHEQWIHWSQALSGEVLVATRNKWQRSWVAYAELPDEMQEADRVWARKVVELLRRRRLIP